MPTKAPEPRSGGLVAARDAFVAMAGGHEYAVRKGDLFEAAHPLVRKHPDLFGPVPLRYPIVEAATAAPGEKRG